VRQPFLTDRLVIKLKEKDNVVHCVYLNDFNMAITAFALQCSEAKNWYDGINKARQIYIKLKQDSDNARILPQHCHNIAPLGSSIGN
jgi:pleckstrin homology domain-containing family G member 5